MHIPIVNMNGFKKNIPDKAFFLLGIIKKKSLKRKEIYKPKMVCTY